MGSYDLAWGSGHLPGVDGLGVEVQAQYLLVGGVDEIGVVAGSVQGEACGLEGREVDPVHSLGGVGIERLDGVG